MISELLAYALGRAHGREGTKRELERTRPRYVYDDEPTRLEMACAVIVLAAIFLVLLVGVFG